MKSLLLIAASLLVSGTTAFAEDFTVATWNLNNFAGQNDTGCHPRKQEDYDAIRSVLNEANADVWLFQEVESASSLARVLDPTQWDFVAEDRPDNTRSSRCQENGKKMTMQRTVTAVRKGLMIGREKDLAFLDVNGNGSLRHGVSINIAVGGKTIELVNVHLKSGCFEGITDQACPTLFEQIPYLASYVNEASRSGRAILVGGDFNRRLAMNNDAAFETLSYNKGTGVEISSITGTSRCSLRGDRPIDYQITTNIFRSALKREEAYEYTFNGPFRSWPSDHCPMITLYSVR